MNKAIDISGMTLQTPRLLLRPWKDDDLADFYEYARVDGVGQMAGWLPHQSIEESRRILGRFMAGKHTFALEHQGKVIGSLGIERYNEAHYPELAPLLGREIGYVLSKDYWGQGLMPEAVQAVIGYLFEVERLDFIIAGYFERNRRSARVQQKCGFVYNKTLPYETQYGTVETSIENILYRPPGALPLDPTKGLRPSRHPLRENTRWLLGGAGACLLLSSRKQWKSKKSSNCPIAMQRTHPLHLRPW